MKTYETPEGLVIGMDGAPLYARAMHADLVAALEIARAYQAKCERIEREYRAAARVWSDENTRAANQLRNAEAACVDAGTFCNGPGDLVNAIGRIRAFRWDAT